MENKGPKLIDILNNEEAMKAYAANTDACRTRIFQEYFNEKTYLNCGVCDVCIKAKKQEKLIAALDQTKSDIMALLTSGQEFIDELKDATEVKNDFVFTEAIRILIDEGKVKMEGYDRLVMN